MVSATAISFLCKLWLALKTYGTNDVYAYFGFNQGARYLGVDLYRAAPYFNHPPFILHFLRLLAWLSDLTGLGFPFWIRFPAILADAGCVWLVWRILGPKLRTPSVRWTLLLLACAPPLIWISGFHGNTDSVMIFFLVLSIYLTGRGSQWAGGAAFGMAMCIKVVPLIAIPVVFLYLRGIRRRVVFFSIAAAVWVAAGSPFIFQNPVGVLRQVFGYRSQYGDWGLSYVALHAAARWPGFAAASAAFQQYGAYAVLAAIAVVSIRMSRLDPAPSLFAQVGLIFFLFLSCSNGFGVQYLAWLVPFAVESGLVPAAVFFATSGTFLFLVYDFWCHGMPWTLADANVVGGRYPGGIDYFQLLCWLSVVGLLWTAWRQMRPAGPSRGRASFGVPVAAGWMAAGLFAAGSLTYAATCQIQNQRSGATARAGGRANLAGINSRTYLVLASWLYGAQKGSAAIAAARTAVSIDPSNGPAFQVLGVMCYGLGRLDESIQAFGEAARLQPDSWQAQANLYQVMEEKRRRSSAR